MDKIPSDLPDLEGFYYTAKHVKHHKLEIGEHTYGMPTFIIGRAGAEIKIGKFCSISNDAKFIIHPEHRPDWITTYPFVRLKSEWPKADHVPLGVSTPFRGNIVMGNDVWIGSNATIMGGAHIGDGAVIGANCIVAGKVKPYSVVVGNPAREIRKRFADSDIARLLEIKWWDWPTEKIQENVQMLCSGDIDGLYRLS